MNQENIKTLLEVVIKKFNWAANKLNKKYYRVEDGVVKEFNIAVIPTSNPNIMYVLTYSRWNKEMKEIEDSLMYRVTKHTGIQNYYNVTRWWWIPGWVTKNFTLSKVRKAFYKNQEKRKQLELGLSIGKTNIVVHDKKMGNRFELLLWFSFEMIPMYLCGAGFRIRKRYVPYWNPDPLMGSFEGGGWKTSAILPRCFK